jgi:hypothetical protein
MTRSIRQTVATGLAALVALAGLSACTTGEVLSGAAGGAAGYVIGQETADDDDDDE